MKKEQIEKAAENEVNSYYYYGEYPFDVSDIKSDARNMFCTGAEWRISSVWHTTADVPEKEKKCLVEYAADGKVQYRVDWRSEYEWVQACHYDKVLRWAYVDDLLPGRKEDME